MGVVQWGQLKTVAGAVLVAPADLSHQEVSPVTSPKSIHAPQPAQPKNDGRFKKGEHRSPATEFKPGQHWRPHQPFREKSWLEREYVEKQRSAGDIAREFGVQATAIYFWLHKHGIPRRSIAEARGAKYWGVRGAANGMYGQRGPLNYNWQGGITPERQALYSKAEWTAIVQAVWDRDHAACRRCGAMAASGVKLNVHHIAPFTVRRFRTEIDNLVLLCTKCHGFVHSRKNVAREFIGDADDA